MGKKIWSNPELYEELSKHQFEETDAASSAFENFMSEVYELRKDYKMLEVSIVASARVKDGDKDMAQVFSAHLGSEEAAAFLLAHALRAALDRPRQAVMDYLSGKVEE